MKPRESIELMIFDCDGVLVDSEVLCHQVLVG
jgi:beta-phosphoglucomutase-like phosphatase (HAD superfamily)